MLPPGSARLLALLLLPLTPVARPYTVRGSFDVGTLETTVFYWKGTLFLLENIGCGYLDHAGLWHPEFEGHSYARVRRLDDGAVVVNITSTIAYGFISAFVDERHGRLWLFGTNHDRCGRKPAGGYQCPGACVQSWWSEDLLSWRTAPTDARSADNVEVAAVAMSPATLPPHRYVLSNECPGFMVNNNADGDLTKGWVSAGDRSGPCGGPSVRWARDPKNASLGWYYRITGGDRVTLARSRDLRKPWHSATFITPTEGDAQAAPFAGFDEAAQARKGFSLMAKNRKSWDWNSNDADVCCMNEEVEGSYVVWGASTQGKRPKAPVPISTSSTNVLGTSSMKLPEMLDAFFEVPTLLV